MMPLYDIQHGPTGRTYQVDAPEGTSDEDLLNHAAEQHTQDMTPRLADASAQPKQQAEMTEWKPGAGAESIRDQVRNKTDDVQSAIGQFIMQAVPKAASNLATNLMSDEKMSEKSGIYSQIKGAITSPMRAYRGELNVNSPEGLQEAMNVAMTIQEGGAFAPSIGKGEGVLGTVKPVGKKGVDVDASSFTKELQSASVKPARQTAPNVYQVFRGENKVLNDSGVAGKGEYSSGRRQAAEAYGKVKAHEVTLENPLKLNYSELNTLQTKLYGKPLTGFEPELSEKFDAYLREQGHDGVVLFDPEISKTVPEEVVKLASKDGWKPVKGLQEDLMKKYPLFDLDMNLEDGGKTLQLNSIAFKVGDRGQGHGEAVMNELKDWAKKNGVEKIDLMSAPGVRGFYEKQGFTKGTKTDEYLFRLDHIQPKTEAGSFDKELQGMAVKHFGTTDTISKAGFIMPDGAMLDFSTKNPKKFLEHEMLESKMLGSTKAEALSEKDRMNFRKSLGMIRVAVNSPNLNLDSSYEVGGIAASFMPTKQQAAKIANEWRSQYPGFDMMIDVHHPVTGSQSYSSSIANPTAEKILNEFKQAEKFGRFTLETPESLIQSAENVRPGGPPTIEGARATFAKTKDAPVVPPAQEIEHILTTNKLVHYKFEELPEILRQPGDKGGLNIKPTKELMPEHKVALNSINEAVASLKGTKRLDEFKQFVDQELKIGMADYEPFEAAMSMVTGQGHNLMMLNTGFKDFRWDASPGAYGARKAQEMFKATGSNEKAAAEMYRISTLHELGHMFDAATDGGLTTALMEYGTSSGSFKTVADFQKYLAKHVSMYAAHSPKDATAELFSMILNGEEPPDKFKFMKEIIRGE